MTEVKTGTVKTRADRPLDRWTSSEDKTAHSREFAFGEADDAAKFAKHVLTVASRMKLPVGLEFHDTKVKVTSVGEEKPTAAMQSFARRVEARLAKPAPAA